MSQNQMSQDSRVFSQSLFSHSKHLSDYIIILQKLSQSEPYAVLASLLPQTTQFLHEVAAAGSV